MAMKNKADEQRIDLLRNIPGYSIAEVSHYLRLPKSTLRAWVRGQRNFEPLIDIAQFTSPLLSFTNLVEVYVLYALTREYNLHTNKLRQGLEYVKREFKSKNPLAEKQFETDGINLFLRESKITYEVSSSQGQVIMDFVSSYLHRIERDELGLPIKLYPFSRTWKPGEPRFISIDPRVSFGRPVLANTGIPVDIVAERYQAGESVEDLARDYSRTKEEVDEAIRYELGVRKAA